MAIDKKDAADYKLLMCGIRGRLKGKLKESWKNNETGRF